MRLGPLVTLAALLFAAAGCQSLNDPMGKENALQQAQRRYTNLVRWGDVEKASHFVDPAMRTEFLEITRLFESLRVTDFEIGEIEYSEAGDAHVRVTYRAYALNALVEKTFTENQEWYQTSLTGWKVRPQLDELARVVGGAR